MTTLENSYCVPKTEEEWALLNPNLRRMVKWSDMAAYKKPNESVDAIGIEDIRGMQEIPVQHFVDLVEDRISVWRLGEVGFDFAHGEWYLCFNDEDSIIMTEDGQFFIVSDQQEIPLYITTFTELLTLIKFLTPPTK